MQIILPHRRDNHRMITEGLDVWWKLDEKTGSTANDSAGSTNGTLHNMENEDWLSPGLSFDGSNEYVIAAKDNTAGNSFSVCLKAYADDTLTLKGIFQWANQLGDGSPFVLIQRNGSDVRFFIHGSYIGTTAMLSNTWNSLIITFSSSSIWFNVYVNGSNVGSIYAGAVPANLSSAVDLYLANGYISYWAGDIRDFRLYNRELSSVEAGRIGRGNG